MFMWHFPILFFFTIFLYQSANCEPVFIKGSVPEAAGSEVQLLAYTDFISNTERQLAEAKIGHDGFFEISLDLKSTTFIYFTIGIQKSELLLEPGKVYNLKITGLLNRELRNKDIPPFQVPALIITVLNPWRFELNGLVQEFLSFHNDFLAIHSMALIRQRDARLVEQYTSELYNLFPGVDNAWFNILLTYNIASVEMMARAGGREAIAGKYLLDEPVLYDHMVYMDFFHQFFEKHLITSRIYERNMLINALESEYPYEALMEMLGKDPLLPGHRLRELVLIKNMYDLSGSPGFRQNNIIDLLDKTKAASKYPEHKLIAENLINLLRQG
jgi:hypothetical protein